MIICLSSFSAQLFFTDSVVQIDTNHDYFGVSKSRSFFTYIDNSDVNSAKGYKNLLVSEKKMQLTEISGHRYKAFGFCFEKTLNMYLGICIAKNSIGFE